MAFATLIMMIPAFFLCVLVVVPLLLDIHPEKLPYVYLVGGVVGLGLIGLGIGFLC